MPKISQLNSQSPATAAAINALVSKGTLGGIKASRLKMLTTPVVTATGVLPSPPTVSQTTTAPPALTKVFNTAQFAAGALDFFGGAPYTPFGSVVRARIGGGFSGSRMDTVFEGTSLCFYLEDNSSPASAMLFRLLAGDADSNTMQYVGSSGSPTVFTTANGLYVALTFPTSGVYRVAVERQYAAGVQGLLVEPTSQAWRPYQPHITALVVGDSYTGGTGSSVYGNSWEYVLGRELGWDIWANGVGGSGYLAGVPFSDSTRTALLSLKPFDAVVIAGGINDAGATYGPNVQAAAAAYFATVRSLVPDALIVVLGAWPGSTGPSTGTNSVTDVEAKIKAAFTAFNDGNSIFIPVSGANQPWIYGSGHVSAPTGAGNADKYIGGTDGNDVTHPNDAGHDLLGRRCAHALRAALGA